MSRGPTPQRVAGLSAAVLFAAVLTACGSDGEGQTAARTSVSAPPSGASAPSSTVPPTSGSSGAPSSSPAPGTPVTQDQAQQIALAAAVPGATVRRVDGPHDEHGQTVWTFEVAVGGTTREISVA